MKKVEKGVGGGLHGKVGSCGIVAFWEREPPTVNTHARHTPHATRHTPHAQGITFRTWRGFRQGGPQQCSSRWRWSRGAPRARPSMTMTHRWDRPTCADRAPPASPPSPPTISPTTEPGENGTGVVARALCVGSTNMARRFQSVTRCSRVQSWHALHSRTATNHQNKKRTPVTRT